MKNISTLILAIALLLGSNAIAQDHISWAAKNDKYSANGGFSKWEITNVKMEGHDVSSLSFDITIDINSMTEKSEKLVAHLKNEDFFDAPKFHSATVHVHDVKAVEDHYMAKGTTNILGNTAEVEFEFEVINEHPLKVKGNTHVDRDVFKIGGENFSHITKNVEVKYEITIPHH